MTGNKEMVGPAASVPIRVFIGYDADVVNDYPLKLIPGIGDQRAVKDVDDLDHTDGDEE